VRRILYILQIPDFVCFWVLQNRVKSLFKLSQLNQIMADFELGGLFPGKGRNFCFYFRIEMCFGAYTDSYTVGTDCCMLKVKQMGHSFISSAVVCVCVCARARARTCGRVWVRGGARADTRANIIFFTADMT
jgi:hypothetical protein